MRASRCAACATPPGRHRHGCRTAGADRTSPTRRFDLVLDAYDGRVLHRAGWSQQTAFGKATAVGIPFHRGEFGLWNQLVLFLFGAGVLFSLVSGPPALIGAAAMCVLMPLLGISAAVVLVLEWLVLQRTRRA